MRSMRIWTLIAAATLLLPGLAFASPTDCTDDVDADGYADSACGGPDCDDLDPAVYPGAPELCGGGDTDCDGLLDDHDPHAGATIVFMENWEASDGGFTGSAGATSQPIWEWGVPTSGPNAAWSGANVWATILTGDYGYGDNSAFLDSSTYTLPAAGVLELSFRYWQDAEGDCDAGDLTTVELFNAAGGFAPIDNDDACVPGLADTGGVWAEAIYDVSSWAGETVWLRIAHDTDTDDNAFPGTYVDDLRLVQLNDVDGDGWSGCADCDDTDPDVNPAAVETCDDGIDNDCDGLAQVTDLDLDGYGSPTCGGDDCDDQDASIFPGATETCDDGIDHDCDGADPASDVDLDGVSNPFCGGDDCDDEEATTHPGAPELCADAVDNDCDPATEDVFDADGDIWTCDLDCDDDDVIVNPGASEVECDGVDNDCDPSTVGDPDVDGDGSVCGLDCDDTDPTRSPLFNEVCNDGVDNDCNPSTTDTGDFDYDGWGCLVDCDDFDADTYPGAPEICGDGVDQDCDSEVDELVDEILTLDDDGSASISLCTFEFPFCGEAWTQVQVQANGRVTFGFDDPSSAALGFFFIQQTPEIAALWSDLDPTTGGEVSVMEIDGASLLVSWFEVPIAGDSSTASSVDLTLLPDGTATLDFGDVDADPALVGYACGTGDVATVDLSEYEIPVSGFAIGSGTEDALYEEFESTTNPLDLSGLSLDLCLTAGEDLDGDGWTAYCGDCDDNDADSYPSAEEICDTLDQDCDGAVDEIDLDGDGYLGSDCGGDDCDDADPMIHPGAEELCNGIDDDCDGDIEIVDNDGDGFFFCEDDCDDDNDAVHPDALEICNQIDDDCNGQADEGFTPDADGDGSLAISCLGDDCNDADSAIHPGAVEVCNSGIDDDCDGVSDDVDADLDGHLAEDCGGGDCDDTDALVNPDVVEVPYDGLDNDCNGVDVIDADRDGAISVEVEGGTDCNDDDHNVHPDAPELCEDGMDNDCDGLTDDSDPLCRGCSCSGSLASNAAGGSGLFAGLILFGLLGLRRRR
jgi:MYXO-CTERM domain-containing protein